VPFACGVAIDYGSELFNWVTNYESTHLFFDIREHLFHPSDAWDLLLALGFCIAIIALATLAIEKWGDRRPAVKTTLLIASLALGAVFLPQLGGK
jgi:hypothetical protein